LYFICVLWCERVCPTIRLLLLLSFRSVFANMLHYLCQFCFATNVVNLQWLSHLFFRSLFLALWLSLAQIACWFACCCWRGRRHLLGGDVQVTFSSQRETRRNLREEAAGVEEGKHDTQFDSFSKINRKKPSQIIAACLYRVCVVSTGVLGDFWVSLFFDKMNCTVVWLLWTTISQHASLHFEHSLRGEEERKEKRSIKLYCHFVARILSQTRKKINIFLEMND